jgi:hypothetical protein
MEGIVRKIKTFGCSSSIYIYAAPVLVLCYSRVDTAILQAILSKGE